MKKLFISGPMTGYENYNRAKFNAVAEGYKKQGYAVLNPAILPNGLEEKDYMQICIAMLLCSDEVVFLPGWHNSPGAVAEHSLACKLKIPLIYL